MMPCGWPVLSSMIRQSPTGDSPAACAPALDPQKKLAAMKKAAAAWVSLNVRIRRSSTFIEVERAAKEAFRAKAVPPPFLAAFIKISIKFWCPQPSPAHFKCMVPHSHGRKMTPERSMSGRARSFELYADFTGRMGCGNAQRRFNRASRRLFSRLYTRDERFHLRKYVFDHDLDTFFIGMQAIGKGQLGP